MNSTTNICFRYGSLPREALHERNQIFKYIKANLKLHWRFQKCMTTLWVVILLVAVGQPSDSKEVLSGNVLVVGQPGLLTIPQKLLFGLILSVE